MGSLKFIKYSYLSDSITFSVHAAKMETSMHEQITCALFLRWSRHDFVLEKILIRICIYYPIFLYFLHRVGEILIYILHAYYKMFSRKCNHYTSFRAQTGTTSNERYDNSTFHCRNIQQQCLSTHSIWKDTKAYLKMYCIYHLRSAWALISI